MLGKMEGNTDVEPAAERQKPGKEINLPTTFIINAKPSQKLGFFMFLIYDKSWANTIKYYP